MEKSTVRKDTCCRLSRSGPTKMSRGPRSRGGHARADSACVRGRVSRDHVFPPDPAPLPALADSPRSLSPLEARGGERLGEARLPGAFQPRQLRGAPGVLAQLPQRYDLAAGPAPARSTRGGPERDRPPSSGSSYLRRGAQSPEGPPESGRGSAGAAPAPGRPRPAARSSLPRSLRGGQAAGSESELALRPAAPGAAPAAADWPRREPEPRADWPAGRWAGPTRRGPAPTPTPRAAAPRRLSAPGAGSSEPDAAARALPRGQCSSGARPGGAGGWGPPRRLSHSPCRGCMVRIAALPSHSYMRF